MQSFTPQFEAIIAAEQSLNSEVALVEANGHGVVFSSTIGGNLIMLHLLSRHDNAYIPGHTAFFCFLDYIINEL